MRILLLWLYLCAVSSSATGPNEAAVRKFRKAHLRPNNYLFFIAMANMRKRAKLMKVLPQQVFLRMPRGRHKNLHSIPEVDFVNAVLSLRRHAAVKVCSICPSEMFSKQTIELLSEFLPHSARPKRQTYVGPGYPQDLWKVMYYEMSPSLSTRAKQAINEGIAFWKTYSCVKNRVRFINDNGCYSQIGMQGGVQYISIGYGCEFSGTTIHEIGHALGFFHTQQRQDRDNAITVLLQNVDPGRRHNFNKMTRAINQNYGAPYDYGSIMQYDAAAFGLDNRITMNANIYKYQDTMGSYLPSFYDIYMINKHYSCECANKIRCGNGGLQNPNKCAECICPRGWGGERCLRRADGCGAPLNATRRLKTVRILAGNGELYDRLKFGICNWIIRAFDFRVQAPKKSKIEIVIRKVSKTYCTYGCYRGGIEIKAIRDHRYTGIRYCCADDAKTKIISEGNVVVVIGFSSYYQTDFVLSYRSGMTFCACSLFSVPNTSKSSLRTSQFNGAKATY